MCGGGGPDIPDPMEEARAEMALLAETKRLEEEQFAKQQQQQQERQRQDAINRTGIDPTTGRPATSGERDAWLNQVQGARQDARGGIIDDFRSAGARPGDYMDMITRALDTAEGGLEFGSTPQFGADLGTNLVNDARQEQIGRYGRTMDRYFEPGFEERYVKPTWDDSILESILSDQYGTASEGIERARARGTLGAGGLEAAMSGLGDQRTAASSRLDDVGGGILSGYRGQLGDIVNQGRTQLNNWDFGSQYQPIDVRERVQGRTRDLRGGLEGDIRGALGGEQLFSLSDLINQGGIEQGAINTGVGAGGGSTELLAAIKDRNKKQSSPRGLGTQGSF